MMKIQFKMCSCSEPCQLICCVFILIHSFLQDIGDNAEIFMAVSLQINSLSN